MYFTGSREMFFQFMNGSFITEIQKAVQFYFLITRSFGGKGKTFGSVKKSDGGACKSQKNVLEKIDAIHERLDKVMIENLDFEKLITQYDYENAFFYCDPPYSQGSPKIRELYKGFDFIAFERLNGINNRSNIRRNKMFKELLIANYPISELYKLSVKR